MMSDVGRWMSAIESVKNPPNKKVKKVANVEQEVLDQFAAKKADEMERELKNYILATFGGTAWDELHEYKVNKKRRKMELEYQRKQKRRYDKCNYCWIRNIAWWRWVAFAFAYYM